MNIGPSQASSPQSNPNPHPNASTTNHKSKPQTMHFKRSRYDLLCGQVYFFLRQLFSRRLVFCNMHVAMPRAACNVNGSKGIMFYTPSNRMRNHEKRRNAKLQKMYGCGNPDFTMCWFLWVNVDLFGWVLPFCFAARLAIPELCA